MNRRNFLKLGAIGATITAVPFVRWARAAEPYAGPFYVHLNANGAWDPIYFCDPKSDSMVARYADIGTAGPFSYAATSITDLAAIGLDAAVPEASAYLMSNEAFFTKYADRVRIINGVDTLTNNHDVGARAAATGQNADGHPSFGAIAAAAFGGDKAIAYVSSNGYDATHGLVANSRLTSGSYARIANPFESDTANPGNAPYHLASTQARIRAAHAARTNALKSREHLPRAKNAITAFERSRLEDDTLSRLQLPTLITLPGNQLGDLQGLLQQIQLVVAGFKAGLVVSSSIGLGGFDTHNNHEANHIRQLAKLLFAIDYLWETAAAAGLADKITLMVTSDFGRGPGFNATNGKDHWPVTSAMFMGRNIAPGQIGGTDAGSRPLRVDPTTLAPNTSGIRITPTHLHQEMRRIAGVGESAGAKQFPLAGTELRLLG
ncbi:MAG: DUF1501 domain-containing protein [Kofleriaceae bacterium]|nr:DUF1501 domain-containing protein [Kofleriaceae bacterium]